MSMIRFRERMAGATGPIARTPWTVPPRGVEAGDGLVRLAATTRGQRSSSLDLRDVDVEVEGIDGDRDGFRATIRGATAVGIAPDPVPVDCGFADILTVSRGGRRMYYRALVVRGPHRYVIEGLKVVRGGVRTAWAGTTTLHTIVVRLDPTTPMPGSPDERATWLEAGRLDGEVVSAGVLRVRGLLRQGLSLRGAVPRFLAGFVRRTLRP